MAELDDVYYLTTLDQVHTLADPLRVRILERLGHEPMTVKMLGVALNEAPAKIHYHVRELERIGVIQLVETREKGGVIEKYYRALAHRFSLSSDLLHTSEPNVLDTIFHELFDVMQRGALSAFRHYQEHPENNEPLALSGATLWATPEEFRALLQQIVDLTQPYQAPRQVEGEREWTVNLIAHLSAPEQEGSDKPAARSRSPRNYCIGAQSYGPKDLENLLAEGQQLDLTIVGVCEFTDDVTPQLADQAVARLRVLGVLHASPEVRAVLQRKGGVAIARD
jgi:DNA-binding transcriptional ArsR family regulator